MDFIDLMEECAPNVSPQTMAAIVQQESNYNPYAIGVNGSYVLERQPKTKQEAIEAVTWLESQGQTNLDLGIGQISSKNRQVFNLSLEDSFNPCKNIQVATSILTDNYSRALASGLPVQQALQAAISEYNTGSQTAGFKNGYVQKVLNNVSPSIIEVPALATATSGNLVEPESTNTTKKLQEQYVYSTSNKGQTYIFDSKKAVERGGDIFVYGNK